MIEIQTVLLDVDGTLIDSNDEHAYAWVDVGREFGYEIEYERVRRMIGMGGDKVLPELTGLTEDSAEGKRILERRGEIFRAQYAPLLQPFEGARDLLVRMRADGYQLVVATSASEEDLDVLLERAGLDDVIGKATSSDDADESKPAPDIIEAALAKGKTGPQNAVMLGDTPYDVKAANRAGVKCVALRCGGWEDDELRGAHAIYDDPADLLRRYSESIFGKK
jgi:phosphoglycolate phosphatase-like HAD superfamily hydrolase